MDVVFSDLDGTLLDAETYSYEGAAAGMALLRSRAVPLVLCTSKTRSEVEYWRERMGNRDPFVVENGGAVYLPAGYFGVSQRESRRRGDYQVWQSGTEYAELVQALEEASAKAGCRVRGFHQMAAGEVGALCGLSPAHAQLAKEREFDEPFVILDPEREGALAAAIEAAGRHYTRGGRFGHIMGNNDKAAAVRTLVEGYRELDPRVRTIGLGDGLNDASFLNVVDVPVLIRSAGLERLQAAVPRGQATALPGPLGWSEAIRSLFG